MDGGDSVSTGEMIGLGRRLSFEALEAHRLQRGGGLPLIAYMAKAGD